MMGRWIPCSERLPEKSGEYLIVYRADFGRIASVTHYSAKNRLWRSWDFMPDVQLKAVAAEQGRYTHWMPLPELPEE